MNLADVVEFRDYLKTFTAAGNSDRAIELFKRRFSIVVAFVTAAGGDIDTDIEIQGLISLAHEMFSATTADALVAEVYKELGDEAVMPVRRNGEGMVDSETH